MNRDVRILMTEVFGALSNPTRLKIVELLLDSGKTVNEIATALGLQQSGTSQHLAVLTRAGVLAMEPRGASRIYRVRGNRLHNILADVEEFVRTEEEPAAEPVAFRQTLLNGNGNGHTNGKGHSHSNNGHGNSEHNGSGHTAVAREMVGAGA